LKVDLHKVEDRYRKYAVIIAYEDGEYLLVKHSDRNTWEVPGGHHEVGESIIDTAKRELFEETGALEYDITHIFDYSVESDKGINYGGLFEAHIIRRGSLPDFEIAQVKRFKPLPSKSDMTYGEIQHRLIALIKE